MTRHTRAHPCPICAGHDAMPRGQGIRCFGFTSADGYTHCSRPEHAGPLEADPNGATYAHRLTGSCRCGMTHGERVPVPALRPAPVSIASRDFPPADEVLALWGNADPNLWAHDDVRAWLEGPDRGLDPLLAEHWNLARVVRTPADLPSWASTWWPRYRLFVRLFDATGALRSVQARRLAGDGPKTLFPEDHRAGGLVFADGGGQWLLREREAPTAGVWICEGLPDFLTWGTAWSDGDEDAPAVIGLPGAGAWAPVFADRIPDGTLVVVAVHGDAAGDAYARAIARDLRGRCRVYRWEPEAATSEPVRVAS